MVAAKVDHPEVPAAREACREVAAQPVPAEVEGAEPRQAREVQIRRTKIAVEGVVRHVQVLALFAECRIHSANAFLHSAKGLPSVSVALGKPHSVKKVTAKASLPSVFFRALGKVFAECQKALGKLFEIRLKKQRDLLLRV